MMMFFRSLMFFPQKPHELECFFFQFRGLDRTIRTTPGSVPGIKEVTKFEASQSQENSLNSLKFKVSSTPLSSSRFQRSVIFFRC